MAYPAGKAEGLFPSAATPVPIWHPSERQNCSTLPFDVAERRGAGGRVAAVGPFVQTFPLCVLGRTREGVAGQRVRTILVVFRYTKIMNRLFCRTFLCLILAACALVGLPAVAQEGPLENIPPKDSTPEEIIKRFAAKEKEFQQARAQYTYRKDVKEKTA